MKNSYVRYQATNFIGKNLEFKNNHIEILKIMKIEDKNTHVIEKIKTYL
jgi:hypothetical protein